jgi:hypothetical protein
VWPFVLFARLSTSPIGMVQWVQWLNVVALWGFGAFALFRAPPHNRRTWLWGIALFAVSPLPILFSRKIWIPDLLPLFGMSILWAHSYRRHWLGAFAWGLLGALIGQVHLSGFFFAFAMFVVTVFRPTTRTEMRAGAWWSWVAGSLVGTTVMIPWALSLFAPHHNAVVSSVRNLASLRFFTGAFLTAWGLDLQYTLRSSFWSDFVRFPRVGGHATYLLGVAHAVLALMALVVTVRWIKRRFRLETDDILTTYLLVALVTGIVMTLSMAKIRVHYLVVVSPFLHLWVVALLENRRKLLTAVTTLQLAITVGFLTFIHTRGGVPGSDYGLTYRSQFLQLSAPYVSPHVSPRPSSPTAPPPPSD